MSLWADIRQRRITQIFLSYIIGGWIILQVVSQGVEMEIAPNWAYRVVLIFFLLGIPAALIIGWYHGEKGAQKAPKIELAALSILFVAAVGMSVAVVRDAVALEELQAGQVDLRSTAVLYFDGIGEEAAAVATGLTEDLIDRLTRVSQLDVASRNASRQVEAEGLRPEEAADELGVGSVLTGSVERFGNDFRVDVRIRDRSGTPIGNAITVEGSATDVLTLQDQLATEVEDAFRTALGDEIRLRESRGAAPNNGAWLAVARGERALQAAAMAARRENAQAAMEELSDADQYFREAIQVGDEWAHPWALRAQVAYEESYLAHSTEELDASLLRTVEMAEEALRREPTEALALYLRGTARYRRFLFGLAHGEDQEALLRSVEEDLESAQTLDRTMAEVPSTLSHLYYQRGDVSSAAIAAQQAYERDAFLQSADGVLRRLFDTNYDLENADRARDWCLEGNRRFPGDYAFVECQLMLMTMNGIQPDVGRAWQLRDSIVAMAPADREYLGAFATQNVGGVIARAGLADSASAVMTRARVGPEVDPEMELLTVEAAMRLLNGENEEALALLQRYSTLNPGHFSAGRTLNWRWRPLQGNPDFERLRRLN